MGVEITQLGVLTARRREGGNVVLRTRNRIRYQVNLVRYLSRCKTAPRARLARRPPGGATAWAAEATAELAAAACMLLPRVALHNRTCSQLCAKRAKRRPRRTGSSFSGCSSAPPASLASPAAHLCDACSWSVLSAARGVQCPAPALAEGAEDATVVGTLAVTGWPAPGTNRAAERHTARCSYALICKNEGLKRTGRGQRGARL